MIPLLAIVVPRVIGLSLACLLSMAEASAAVPAPEALREALVERYPLVTRWEIEALNGDGIQNLATSEPVAVLKIGPRSAVRSRGAVGWYAVRGWRSGWVTKGFIDQGRALSALELQPGEVDVVGTNCAPLEQLPQPGAWRAKTRLTRGSVVCAEHIELIPAVTRGSEVTVKVLSRTIVLETTGRATTDGNLGDRLVVRTSSAGALIQGEVTGPAEVSIYGSQ